MEVKRKIEYIISSSSNVYLTQSRITRLIYASEVLSGEKVNFQSYVTLVGNALSKNKNISSKCIEDQFGNKMTVYKLKKESKKGLYSQEKELLDSILIKTDKMNWMEFSDFISEL